VSKSVGEVKFWSGTGDHMYDKLIFE